MPAAVRTPESESLDVVLVGSFNPAIFHPQWFLRQELVGENEADEAKVKMVSSQITDVQFGGVRAVCVTDRLTLSTPNVAFTEKIHDLATAILRLLPHTPVRACGINPQVHYRVQTVAYWHKIGNTLAPKNVIWNDLFPEPGMQSLTIKAPRGGVFPGETNVTVGPSDRCKPGFFVHANTHYDVPKASQHMGGASGVRDFILAEWNKACEQARRVADQIFQKIKTE
ncbi:MAG TPA: hypothetical protein VIS96_06840 [Terrimicrobiaceae bacterium]